MAMLRFLFRRLVAQRLLALGVVLTLAFSVGVMASGPIYTDAARDFILASSIATAGTPIKNVRVDVYGDPSFDWTAADRQVRAASSVLPVDTIVIARRDDGPSRALPGLRPVALPRRREATISPSARDRVPVPVRSRSRTGSRSRSGSGRGIGWTSWVPRTGIGRSRYLGSSIRPSVWMRSGSGKDRPSRSVTRRILSRSSWTEEPRGPCRRSSHSRPTTRGTSICPSRASATSTPWTSRTHTWRSRPTSTTGWSPPNSLRTSPAGSRS
jgi:hypothetical protein